LVVVAIISLLSSLVLSSLATSKMRANDAKIAQDLRQFRTAANLYYNDNRVYPATAMNYQDTKLADEDNSRGVSQNSWAHKLAFFIKTADAAAFHTTALCRNFDVAATAMVSGKYLSVVPVHPYDNDAKGVCYKAVRSASTNSFAAYGILTTQVSLTTGSKVSKRTGFIEGDTSKTGVMGVVAAVALSKASDEIVYPAGLDGTVPFAASSDSLTTVDSIDGITGGSTNITVVQQTVADCSMGRGEVFDPLTQACRVPFAGTRVNSASCVLPLTPYFYGDICLPSSENPPPHLPIPPPPPVIPPIIN
jgi:type II secretory pathway pseudopilin PulG